MLNARSCAKALPAASMLWIVGAFSAPSFAQDDAGQVLFNNSCRTCHTLDAGDNRLGPTLHGIVGSKAGASPAYPFSDAMRKSGLTWDEATLDRFIADPQAVVPGNNMKPYGGMASADDRAKIVAFLKAQGGAAAQ